MGSSGLLDRAKDIMRGRGLAKSAMAIAPLAMSVPALADAVFMPGLGHINGSSGGAFGRVFPNLPIAGGGVSLSGNTNITGALYTLPGETLPVTVDPANYPHSVAAGYLSAKHAAMNGGLINYTWNGDLTGTVAAGDYLNVFRDFSIKVLRGYGSTGEPDPFTWDLTATVTYVPGFINEDDPYADLPPAIDLTYSIDSAHGELMHGASGQAFDHAGMLVSWDVKFNVQWDVNDSDTVFHPRDRLAVDIPSGTSIDLFITSGGPDDGSGGPGGSPGTPGAVAAPLPPAAWAGTALLGWVGIGRLRRRGGARRTRIA